MASIPRFNVNSRSHNKESDRLNNGNYSNDSSKTKDSLGFGNIPEQMHRKAVKKGFNFTIMVVGESGLGKSTFINTLLMNDLYKDRELLKASDMIETTTKVVKRFIELDEKGVKLRLTIIDTPGFSDALNSEGCWDAIADYVDGAFDHYFKEECGLNRKNIQDNRVHCCLYFISPYGYGLRPIDIRTIQELQSRVNVVPVIAKADCLTSSELRQLKSRILHDIERHQLTVYQLPECDSDEEDTLKSLDTDIKSCLPFCVMGHSNVGSAAINNAEARKYPWGSADLHNDKHCDFNKLRLFLLKTHMQDLKDMTSDVLYENYRARCITERMNRRQTERQIQTPSLNTSQSTTVGGLGASSANSSISLPPQGTPISGSNTPKIAAGLAQRLNNSIASGDSRAGDMTEQPGFEAIVDPENLLLHKEKEIAEMRQLCEKLQSQLQSSSSPTTTNGGASNSQPHPTATPKLNNNGHHSSNPQHPTSVPPPLPPPLHSQSAN